MNHPAPLAEAGLREARRRLSDFGEIAGGLSERLALSWQRSLAAGLMPAARRLDSVEHLSGSALARTLARNHELLSYSGPVMEYLFEQVRHSHSMVVLADRQGVLMHTLGDADFLTKAERVTLSAGASWHEQQRGTNAIGTALADEHGVEIHGGEHFLDRHTFLTCAAAPIMAAGGDLAGILDISGDQRSRHPHTLGLVNTAARMIENRLVSGALQKQLRLHLHAQPEGIGSVAEGIVGLSAEGWITGANRTGLSLLGLQRADIGATPLQRVLDVRLDTLLNLARRQPGQPIRLHRHDGSALYVSLQGETRPVLNIASTPAAPVNHDDALARLDTGDAAWRSALDKARRIAGKDIPLLLHGESGVGKEWFAKAFHQSSPKADGPFVAINCAALPEHLIESELFGYTSGAFTGAKKEGHVGKFREADGGTLFLDEIGDMPLAMQAKLLRVLQERQVTPLGSSKAHPVRFALICATHRNLRQAAEEGSFRSDLYYRLNGLTLQLPPLRQRTDFAAVTGRLLADLCPGQNLRIDHEVLERLASHRWPGNLRQYGNLLRTAAAMLDPGETVIDWRHLPDDIADELFAAPAPSTPSPTEAPSGNLRELSRAAIEEALRSCHGNVSQAARRLGISRQTLYRKLPGR